MKKSLCIGILIAFVMIFSVGASFGETDGKLNLKASDDVYACACGKACSCDTLSHRPGKCTCGIDLAKGKVTKVEGEFALVKMEKEEKLFKTTGKYACSGCGTISQDHGTCSCGKALARIEVTK
jgi:hypothetical protein